MLRAANLRARLIIFPEATMCRFGVPLAPIAEPADGPWATAVSRMAIATGVTAVVGMFTPGTPADGQERVRNTLLIASADRSVTTYDKIHLFDAFGYAESATVEAGNDPVTAVVNDITVGVATCYDIRFPGLFQTLAAAGARLIVVPSSWGDGPGKLEQWRLLSAARALDSTSYVAAVGQALPADEEVRNSPSPTGIGHSLLVDPLGSVLVELSSEPELAIFDLEMDSVDAARSSIAVLDNRRF